MNKVLLGIASVSSVCVLGFFVQQEHQYQRQQEFKQVVQEAKSSLTLIERQFLHQDSYLPLNKNSEQ